MIGNVTSRYPEPKIGDSVPIENGFFNVRVGMTRACIYAMGPAEASPLKIGLAHHPIARQHELQIGNWIPILIHRVIFAGLRRQAMGFERRLIERFAERRLPRVRGDWFSISLEDFDTAASEIINVGG